MKYKIVLVTKDNCQIWLCVKALNAFHAAYEISEILGEQAWDIDEVYVTLIQEY